MKFVNHEAKNNSEFQPNPHCAALLKMQQKRGNVELMQKMKFGEPLKSSS
jgi:hypothetical protein